MSRITGSADDLAVNPDWQPPSDPVFQYLLEEALFGTLPVYFAAVPLGRIRRFAPTFRPENTADGGQVVEQIMAAWRQGHFEKMWVYPKGDQFIMSDDYFTLAAAERGKPDYLPCWVLGRPRENLAHKVQGPIRQEDVRRMFGAS